MPGIVKQLASPIEMPRNIALEDGVVVPGLWPNGGPGGVTLQSLARYTFSTDVFSSAFSSKTDLSAFNSLSATVSALSTGQVLRQPVETISFSNQTLSGERTISGVATNVSRVALVGQTNPAQNGVYFTSSSNWVRTRDTNTSEELNLSSVQITGGNFLGDRWIFRLDDPSSHQIDVDPVTANKVSDDSYLFSLLDYKADLESPEFTGVPVAPNPNGLTPDQVATVSFARDTVNNSEIFGKILSEVSEGGSFILADSVAKNEPWSEAVFSVAISEDSGASNDVVFSVDASGQINGEMDTVFRHGSPSGGVVFSDEKGQPFFQISDENPSPVFSEPEFSVHEVDVNGTNTLYRSNSETEEMVFDENEVSGISNPTVRADGVVYCPFVTGSKMRKMAVSRDLQSKVVYGDGVLRGGIFYGQSLCSGKYGTRPPTALNTSPIDPFSCLMFPGEDGGLTPRLYTDPDFNSPDRRQDRLSESLMDRFVPLREAVVGDSGETMVTSLIEELQKPDGFDYRKSLVVANVGIGGTSGGYLVPGGAPYYNVTNAVRNMADIAHSMGMGFELSFFVFEHGHNDADNGYQNYIDILNSLETGVSEICNWLGQKTLPVFAISNVSLSNRAFYRDGYDTGAMAAQSDWAIEVSDKSIRTMYGPQFLIPRGSDGTHPDLDGYRAMGQIAGRQIKSALNGNREVVRPGTLVANSGQVEVEILGTIGGLVSDTTFVSDPGNFGFKLYSEGAEVPINAASIVGNRVFLAHSGTLGANRYLDYAMTALSEPSGPTTGPRGTIADGSGAGETLATGMRPRRYLVNFRRAIP